MKKSLILLQLLMESLEEVLWVPSGLGGMSMIGLLIDPECKLCLMQTIEPFYYPLKS